MALMLALALPGVAVAQQAAPTIPSYLRADLYPEWLDASGKVKKWPENNGCAAAPVSETLPEGKLIDRFGSENGTFFSPKGESYAGRAVPYVCSQMVYTVYKVTKPLTVSACKAAPWFGEPGGATQYQTTDSALKLREAGIIEVAANDNTANGGAASPCGRP